MPSATPTPTPSPSSAGSLSARRVSQQRKDVAQCIVVRVRFIAKVAPFGEPEAPPLDPVDLYFSDTEYADPVAGFSARPLILDMGSGDFSISEQGIYSGGAFSSPRRIRIAARNEMRAAIQGLTCEDQPIEIRKGSVLDEWASLTPTYSGRCSVNVEDGGGEWTITSEPTSALFRVPVQDRVWAGRGRIVNFNRDDLGCIDFSHPGNSSWDYSTAATVEIGFEVDGLVGGVQGLAFQDLLWGLVLFESSGEIFNRIIWHDGVSFKQRDSAVPVAIGTRHHFALVWDGVDVKGYLDQVEVISSPFAASNAPQATDLAIGRFFAQHFDGKVDRFRLWSVARSAGQLAATGDGPAPDNDRDGLLIELNFLEGLTTYTGDSVQRITGNLSAGAEWYASRTGLDSQRGEPKPFVVGQVDVVVPRLIDAVDQIYAYSFRDVKKVIPRVGMRSLASEYSTTGNVVFSASEGSIRGDAGSLIDLSGFVGLQKISIAGTVENDGEFVLVGEPTISDGEWLARIDPAPVDEGPVSATFATVSAFANEITATSLGDFDNATRSFVSTDGTDLSAFEIGRPITISVPGGINDAATYTLRQAPTQTAAGAWVLWFRESMKTEAGVTATFTSSATAGEYELLGDGQFKLLFTPSLPVTCYVEGDNLGGYVDTPGAVARRLCSAMGSVETRVVDFDRSLAKAIDLERPYTCGVWRDGTEGSTLYDVLTELLPPASVSWSLGPQFERVTLSTIPTPQGYGIERPIDKLVNALAWATISRDAPVRSVRVQYARNSLIHREDDLDFALRGLPSAYSEALRDLGQVEWRSEVWPVEEGQSSGEGQLVVSTALSGPSSAIALARRIYESVAAIGGRVFEVDLGPSSQVDNALTRYLLTDTEEDGLDGSRGYFLGVDHGDFGTRLLVLVL